MSWNPLELGRLARTGLTVAVLGASVAAGTVPSALARHTAGPANAPVSGGTLNYRDLDTPGCVDPLIAPTTVEGLADYPTFDNRGVARWEGCAAPRSCHELEIQPRRQMDHVQAPSRSEVLERQSL